MSDDPDLTVLLQRAGADPAAGEALLPRVYDELRRLAGGQMGREAKGHTLQATALVHEAWMKLVGADGESLSWDSRGHFFSAAALAMRRILVDRARRVRSEKHGGAMRRQPLEMADRAFDPDDLDFVALDAALTELSERDPRAAKVVELRFFGGLSVEDTASVMGVSERTVAREWNVAKAWLARALSGSQDD
ncbi:RNA polymerase sigma factor [Planctomycetes bacterium Poly30]|uniref:RNA polymerase sigma factor n=1 Tax=Saltatorellus ferox TaxID=2528018 RepID=A0A518EWC4_9BACT|nr:RNA polymerase sigma factor [Planctomycetes bacterium Poly30]